MYKFLTVRINSLFFFAIWNKKELEPKGIPQLFVGLLAGMRQSAIGQFLPCPW